jgi:hypothetical protein
LGAGIWSFGVPEELAAAEFLDSQEFPTKGDTYFVDHLHEAFLWRTFDATGEANGLSFSVKHLFPAR